MKNTLNKQEKERLNNKTAFFSSVIILYAILLMFVQKMSTDPMTVNGAIAFIEILRWVSLAGAMGCAAWSAYKENKNFFVYCSACILVFLSTTALRVCTAWGSFKPFYVNYVALAVLFVLGQIYHFLKLGAKFNNALVTKIFAGCCIAIFVIFVIAGIILSIPAQTFASINI